MAIHSWAGAAFRGHGTADRVAVVAGLRTPFARRSTAYRDLVAADLGALVVRELVFRAEIHPREIGLVVYGQAIPSPATPNVAREIVLRAGLPKSVDAFTVVRACATSFQAATSAAEAILAGQHEVAIVGGAESACDVPGAAPEKEASTGLTMGEHAERMAKEMGISREDQDRFAHRSHTRAAAAWERGVFAPEVMHVIPPPAFDRPIARDDAVRPDSRIEAYRGLPPVFDRAHGTVTAGTSAPLADGASALLLMREAKARALGYEPLGFLRAWAYAALGPEDGLLMGPAYATPIALDRAGLRLADVDLVDMHEAFAAQVLCNKKAFASRRFAEDELGRTTGPIGEIDEDRFNVHGGSIALGHPFAATGARIVHTVLRELRRRGGRFGLATSSAAGGLGASIVLEVA
jgi:acetyl-CoA acyltransferase